MSNVFKTLGITLTLSSIFIVGNSGGSYDTVTYACWTQESLTMILTPAVEMQSLYRNTKADVSSGKKDKRTIFTDLLPFTELELKI